MSKKLENWSLDGIERVAAQARVVLDRQKRTVSSLTPQEANVLLFETEDAWRKTDADADPVLYRARVKLKAVVEPPTEEPLP